MSHHSTLEKDQLTSPFSVIFYKNEITYFFTLSKGMPIAQKTKEPRPPERKVAVPVLIYLGSEAMR